MTTNVILNPTAGRGRGERLLDQIRSRFSGLPDVEFASTQNAGDEERLARIAIRKGATQIIAVGGDGTCSRIANTILRTSASCRLAVVPTGTGNDFAKTLGVNKYTPDQIAELVVQRDTSRIDVGLADGRYFLNSCGFGFDASVLDVSNRVRFLKGNAVYIYSALGQLFTYRGIEVTANGVPGVIGGQMLMVTVSNGRWLGGAFQIAPHASVVDGELDVCFIGDSNVISRVKLFVGAMRGQHLDIASVSSASVQELTLSFASSPSMEIDGELRHARSKTVEVKCVPRALSVVAAPGAVL